MKNFKRNILIAICLTASAVYTYTEIEEADISYETPVSKTKSKMQQPVLKLGVDLRTPTNQ